MVIVAIVKAFFAVLKLLLSPLNLPSMADTIMGDVVTLMGYISGMAYNMVYFILPKGTVQVLFGVLMSVITARYVYAFIMWVIKKIPGGMS